MYTTPITLVNCTPTSQLTIHVSYNGVSVYYFYLSSGYHCYSYYLSDYKLGVQVYCLWPLLFVCLTIVLVCIVYTTPITLVNCTPTSQLPIRVSYNSVSVYYFYLSSGYHCYSYYLSDYKLGVHVYCLWPPHYYTLGVDVYCLWPLLFMCPTIVLVCIV